MEHYLAAKLKLLGLVHQDAVIATNADDPAWAAIPDLYLVRSGGTPMPTSG